MQKQVIVIAGPSGSGKNTILQELLKKGRNYVRLITATTRSPREGERDGVDYIFLSEKDFKQGLKDGTIPEHRFIPELGTYYGIYLPNLRRQLEAGKIVLAQVDIIGARLLKERYNATTIFIMPASLKEFENRVRARNPKMSAPELSERMRIASIEMDAHSPEYDYRIQNADGKLEGAVDEVVAILKKEGYTV
ncbi:MAG: guanylate kinase [bacterium]|nr:guanylate kinase [bacterium]